MEFQWNFSGIPVKFCSVVAYQPPWLPVALPEIVPVLIVVLGVGQVLVFAIALILELVALVVVVVVAVVVVVVVAAEVVVVLVVVVVLLQHLVPELMLLLCSCKLYCY